MEQGIRTEQLLMRDEVAEFGLAMEKVLQKYDGEKGENGWADSRPSWLELKLIEEVAEYFKARELDPLDFIRNFCAAFINAYKANNEKEEIIDVANVCMMIWDNLRKEKKDEDPTSLSGL